MTRANRWFEAAGITPGEPAPIAPAIRPPVDRMSKMDRTATAEVAAAPFGHYDHFAQPPGVVGSEVAANSAAAIASDKMSFAADGAEVRKDGGPVQSGQVGHCVSAPEPRTAPPGPTVPACWLDALTALEAAPAPAGWHPDDWREAVQGARVMLRNHGTALDACAWSALEVFGLDGASPWYRRDVGLCRFLVDGWRVSAVAAQWIELRTPKGSRLTYPRRALRAGLVLAWEASR